MSLMIRRRQLAAAYNRACNSVRDLELGRQLEGSIIACTQPTKARAFACVFNHIQFNSIPSTALQRALQHSTINHAPLCCFGVVRHRGLLRGRGRRAFPARSDVPARWF